MDEFITVGEIIKSRGIKGELKVKPLTDDITRFNKLRVVWIDTAPFRVLGAQVSPPFVYLRLQGVDTKEGADLFKNKFIMVERIHAAIPDEGAFFIADIVGCSFESERLKGRVTNVYRHGAADVFEINLDGGKTMMFPFLKKLNLDINIEVKKITANQKLLDEVAVYED